MPFLVTSLPSPSAGIRTPHLGIFDTLDDARVEATRLLMLQSQDVSIWEQVATPKLQQTVDWS